MVDIAIDEILDDADLVSHAEDFHGLAAQVSLMDVMPLDCSMENFVMENRRGPRLPT